MIGKPEWFTYRIFGWGIRPKKLMGWVYIAIFAALCGIIAALPIDAAVKAWIIGILIAAIVLDVLHIMVQLPKVHDERENFHQLIIERNCSFAAIAAIAGVAIFQSVKNIGSAMQFDASIIVVLGAMLVAKIATAVYVKAKL